MMIKHYYYFCWPSLNIELNWFRCNTISINSKCIFFLLQSFPLCTVSWMLKASHKWMNSKVSTEWLHAYNSNIFTSIWCSNWSMILHDDAHLPSHKYVHILLLLVVLNKQQCHDNHFVEKWKIILLLLAGLCCVSCTVCVF